MMEKELILVIGASGFVGSELVKILKADGYAVRGTTSKVTAGANTVKIDVGNGEGLSEAFEGVTRVFLMAPLGFTDHHAVLSPLIKEAKRRQLKKVVLMTAFGANASDEIPFRKAEIELEQSGLDYVILRPNWFFENFSSLWLTDIREKGTISIPAGNDTVSFIDTKDIAAAAAVVLIADQFNKQAFELTGSAAVDHHAVAREISAVTGKAITYWNAPPETLKVTLLADGLSEAYASLIVLLVTLIKDCYYSTITTAFKDITGRDPKTLHQYVVEHQDAWL
jgi:uncharacterized protein YbjT (DUF2867 family)